MPKLLGRIRYVVRDSAGNAVSGATVLPKRQGATVVSGSGGPALVVNVNDRGALWDLVAPENTVEVWRGGNTQILSSGGSSIFTVTATTPTSITLDGFSGTLSLSNNDRIVHSGDASPRLYRDITGTELASGADAVSDSNGVVQVYAEGGKYDLKVINGANTVIVEDINPEATRFVYLDDAKYFTVGDGTADDALAITKAVEDCNPGDTLILGDRTYGVGSQVTFNNGIIVDGPPRATITALGTFPTSTAVVKMQHNRTKLKNIQISATNISGSICVETAAVGKYGGLENVSLDRYVSKGLLVDSASSNFVIRDVYAEASSVATIAQGVHLSGCGQTMIDGLHVDSVDLTGTKSTYGLNIDGTTGPIIVKNVDAQGCGDGVRIAANNVNVTGVRGGSRTVDAVQIETGFGNITLKAIAGNGGTNTIRDNERSVTVTNSATPFVSFYSISDVAGTSVISSEEEVPWVVGSQLKMDNNFLYKDREDIASSAGTLNLPANSGNYFRVTDSGTNITSITSTASSSSRPVILEFQNAGVTVVDNGSTLNLEGNYISVAGGMLFLTNDGSNWKEIVRRALPERNTAHTLADWNTTVGTEQEVTGNDAGGAIRITSNGSGDITTVLTYKDGAYSVTPTVVFQDVLTGTLNATIDLSEASVAGWTVTPTTTTLTFSHTSLGATTSHVLKWRIVP